MARGGGVLVGGGVVVVCSGLRRGTEDPLAARISHLLAGVDGCGGNESSIPPSGASFKRGG